MTRKRVNENKPGRTGRGVVCAFAAAAMLAAAAVLFAALPAAAESTDRSVEKEVWSMRDMYVRLEAQDKYKGNAPPPNQHPVTIAPSQLYNALSQITILTHKKDGHQPLFSEFELDILSKNLAAALAEAGPSQDVTFAVNGWHKGGGMFGTSVETVTTGRVFYHNGQINLIIGDAHRPVDMGENFATNAAAVGDRRLDPFVPGMRGFTKRHKWTLGAEPDSGVYSAPGGKRSDWLVFSAQALSAPPPAIPGRPGAPSAAEQARYDALSKQVQQLQQQLQQLQQSRGAAPATAVPGQPAPNYQQPAYPNQGYPQPAYPNQGYQQPGYPAPTPGTSQVPGQSPSGGNSVEQRLLVLDDLKNKGLISEEEYQQRRAQVLSGY